jgi:hypothetical protein
MIFEAKNLYFHRKGSQTRGAKSAKEEMSSRSSLIIIDENYRYAQMSFPRKRESKPVLLTFEILNFRRDFWHTVIASEAKQSLVTSRLLRFARNDSSFGCGYAAL